jgi:hypothetical protein
MSGIDTTHCVDTTVNYLDGGRIKVDQLQMLWDRITLLLPSCKRKKKAARPRMNDRKARSQVVSGMLF